MSAIFYRKNCKSQNSRPYFTTFHLWMTIHVDLKVRGNYSRDSVLKSCSRKSTCHSTASIRRSHCLYSAENRLGVWPSGSMSEDQGFFSSPLSLLRFWGPPHLLINRYSGQFPKDKTAGAWTDQSPPSRAQVKNASKCTSISPVYFHEWYVVKNCMLLYAFVTLAQGLFYFFRSIRLKAKHAWKHNHHITSVLNFRLFEKNLYSNALLKERSLIVQCLLHSCYSYFRPGMHY